jgi:hypothetical protein
MRSPSNCRGASPASVYAATVAQVQQLVDGLDTETALAWANEIAPDAVPSFATWARPERPEGSPRGRGTHPGPALSLRPRWLRLAGGFSYPARRSYWMTSVTWSRISLGKVIPSSLAVFMLITRSKRIDCSIGRSAGFAPLRSRST